MMSNEWQERTLGDTKAQNGWLCGTGYIRVRFTSVDADPKFGVFESPSADQRIGPEVNRARDHCPLAKKHL